MGLKYIYTTVDTTALYSPQLRGYGTAGIAGWSLSADKDTPEFFRGISDPKDEYGETSGLYRSIFSFFENKGKELYGIAFDGVAQPQEDFNVVAGQTEFTLSYYPLPPVTVQADLGSGMVSCTEGVEYDVDYGNKQVIFRQGYEPEEGTDNVLVDGYATTPALVEAALDELLKQSIQIVSLGYVFDPTILEKLKDHLVTADSEGSYRVGYYNLPKGVASDPTVSSYISSLACDFGGLVAHNSLKDPASALCGITSYIPPQRPLTFKQVKGLEQTEVFSNTEIAFLAGDGGKTGTGKNVIVIDNPERSTIDVATGWGYTISEDSALRYMDTVRVIQAVKFALEAGLTDPNIIGNDEVDISTVGLRTVRNKIDGIILPFTRRPNKMLHAYKIVIPLEAIVNNNSPKPAEREVIRSAVVSRAIDYELEIDYRGSLNTISGVVRFVPGGSAGEE